MEVKVRRFLPEDLKIVTEIEKHCSPKRPWSEKEFLKWHTKMPEGFLIAEIEGEPAGYIVTSEDNIQSLVVKENFRRHGIGRILVDEVIKSRGIKKFVVHVRASNKVVQEFNKSLGFRVVSTKKQYYKNGEDAVEMVKTIE